jgi:uncharacterized protein with ParB-like and HNH nuclease domain
MSDKIDTIKEEEEDFYSNDDLYNINSWGADLSFRELITMYEENELVKPELQRKYVWDKAEASRFIESILLGLPVPSIFLANTKDEQKLIIDGFQRIMTVNDFVAGIWSKDKKIFKLSNSEKINPKWKGKAYKELSDTEQRRIKSTTIHAIIFEQKSPKRGDTSLYQIFERINTSGRSLLPQEIRNCVYQGDFNTLLFELNKNEKWRTMFGEDKEDERMRDMEFILRFFALDSNEIKKMKKGGISLKKFLNEYMGSEDSSKPAILKRRKTQFEDVIDFIYSKFGEDAFYNVQSNDLKTIRKRFYPTVFDSLMIATSIALENGFTTTKKDLEPKRLLLLKDKEYRQHITEGTMKIESIHGRISIALKTLYGMDY